MKNLFLRLSVLQSISGIFSRFFLLHYIYIFLFSHKISSFFCFGPYYYAVSRKNFFRISFGFSRCCFMFLYKTFWNLYKTKYFLYKNRREFRHVFSGSPVFFIQTADFLGAFPVFLSERVRFSRLPIRFFKSVFYLVGYDSLVSFPSVCLFLRILLIKNLFFQNEPSFRICIFSLFVWVFSYFFGCSGRFFCPASHPFLHFFRPLAKNNLLFFHPDHPFSEIFSLRRNNFSCLFPSGTEKFFCPFRYFLRFS